MTHAETPSQLAAAFVTLNDFVQAGGGQTVALQRLVELAVSSVPGCDWAAVTAWPSNGRPRSLASSGAVARDADNLQYDLAEGPCLTAAADNETVLVPDLSDDGPWPRFAAAARSATPIRSVLSFHLVDDPHRVALNLYSTTAGAFDPDAVATGALFAAHARVLLVHAASADKAVNLEQALATSRQIGAAIGILMNAHKITADQAFALLRKTSQNLNRKLRDVADDVTDTGTLPGPT